MCQKKYFKTNRNESIQWCTKTQLTLHLILHCFTFFLGWNWLDNKFFKTFLQQENFWLFVMIWFKWCHFLQLSCILTQTFWNAIQKFCIDFVTFCKKKQKFWKGLQIFCNNLVLSCENRENLWKCLQNFCIGFVSNLYCKIFQKSCINFVQILQYFENSWNYNSWICKEIVFIIYIFLEEWQTSTYNRN